MLKLFVQEARCRQEHDRVLLFGFSLFHHCRPAGKEYLLAGSGLDSGGRCRWTAATSVGFVQSRAEAPRRDAYATSFWVSQVELTMPVMLLLSSIVFPVGRASNRFAATAIDRSNR